MTIDFNLLKIQTFSNINDTPVAPTASKAGNGSHLISQFNQLIDKLQENFEAINSGSNNSSNWIQLTGGSELDINQNYILLLDTTENYTLVLPTNLEIGNWVGLFKANNGLTIDIIDNGNKFNNSYPESIDFIEANQYVELIWTGEDYLGWQPTKPEAFNLTIAGSGGGAS